MNETKLGLALDRTRVSPPGASGADIVDALALHRRSLNRRSSAVGVTFRQVPDRVRFAVAKELLENSEISLAEIAYALGYAHDAAFLSAFRRRTGMTPGGWRPVIGKNPMKPHPGWRPNISAPAPVGKRKCQAASPRMRACKDGRIPSPLMKGERIVAVLRQRAVSSRTSWAESSRC